MEYPKLSELIEVIRRLRDPENGCPWDIKQTHRSLLKFLIEESYEFVNAVNNDGFKEIEDELGDVLLQVVLHAQIGSENEHFDIESVACNLTSKMKRRHPHVFGEISNSITTEQVKENWAQIKKIEKNTSTRITKDVLDFPALFSANKIGEKTNRFGFDWENVQQVENVVIEEWNELQDEINADTVDYKKVEEEYGDLLFSVAQLGRHLNINPEMSLKSANAKFLRRFHQMEGLIEAAGLSIENMNQQEMDLFWKKVKKGE